METQSLIVGRALLKYKEPQVGGVSVSAMLLRDVLKEQLRPLNMVGRVIVEGQPNEKDIIHLAADGFNVVAYNLTLDEFQKIKNLSHSVGVGDRLRLFDKKLIEGASRRSYYHGVISDLHSVSQNPEDDFKFVKKCAKAIVPGGILSIKVPSIENFDSLSMDWIRHESGLAESKVTKEKVRLWNPNMLRTMFNHYFYSIGTHYSSEQDRGVKGMEFMTVISIRRDNGCHI